VSQYRDTAVVLRTWKLGEADRIVALYTEHHGKVRAVAKGVRRTKSRFGARLEPPTCVALQLHAGRNLDTITQAETVDNYRAVREDLDRLARGVSLLEAVDQLGVEGEPDPALFRMLVGALRTLAVDNPPLVVPAFYLKVLAQTGFGPVVDACAVCGSDGPLVAFDTERGGMLCNAHRHGLAVSPDAVDLVAQILGGGLAAALAATTSPATTEVDRVATAALEHHLERRLRAPTVLHRG
jgi:DNA repair protein RecO (recombination protein O)